MKLLFFIAASLLLWPVLALAWVVIRFFLTPEDRKIDLMQKWGGD
jgi:hypothetical protein